MSFIWTENLTTTTTVKSDHFTELQDNIDSVYDNLICQSHNNTINTTQNVDHRGTHYGTRNDTRNNTVRATHYGAVRATHYGTRNGTRNNTVRATHYGTVQSTRNNTIRGTHYNSIQHNWDSSFNSTEYSFWNNGNKNVNYSMRYDTREGTFHYTVNSIRYRPNCSWYGE